MEGALFRFVIVWIVLHIILFFVERYRYKHSNWSWYGFKNEGMLIITYTVITLDKLCVIFAIVGGLIYWILQPTIK